MAQFRAAPSQDPGFLVHGCQPIVTFWYGVLTGVSYSGYGYTTDSIVSLPPGLSHGAPVQTSRSVSCSSFYATAAVFFCRACRGAAILGPQERTLQCAD